MRSKPVSNPLSISLRKPVRPQSILTVILWGVFFSFHEENKMATCYGCI